MTTTVTKARSLQTVLDEANPNELADALRKAKLGTLLAPLKRTFTGLTAASAFDLTAIDGTGETAGAANPNRLPALAVTALRVTAVSTSNAEIGSYAVADAGATPLAATNSTVVGLATISDDGKTITFPSGNHVTAFVIEYIPRILSTTDMAGDFAPST